MITIAPAKESDIKEILSKYSDILLENMNELKYENTMILIERGEIYGVSSYTLIDNYAKIEVLFIDEDKRRLKFGDSLIKATLNLIDKRNISKAYIIMDECYEEFLRSASLIKSTDADFENDSLNLEHFNNSKAIYHANLPEFFNTACRSSHKN